jgi:threonine dehydrogenase-like Zn-dependent dehydrogenase
MAAVIEPRDIPAMSTVLKNPDFVATPTCTITSKKDPSHPMRAVEYHGKQDMKVKIRPRPMLTDPSDVILRVTTSCICGSDLHMYMGAMPGMKSGDVVGHEFMGVVEAVGPEVKSVHEGDRVVAAFDIACGQCSACHRKDFSGCDSTNPSKEQELMYNDRTCGMFGYSHMTGGWEGGQAEYVRIPFADMNCLKVPEEMDDEHAILLSDILPTAWHANELARVEKGDNVAIWGCGPVGILAAQCAFLRGANRVVIIDEQQHRLDFAVSKVKGLETINFLKKKVTEELRRLFPHGPDVGIEAVGVHYVANWLHKVEYTLGLETDSTEVLNEIIYAVRKGGRIGIVGAYAGYANHFNLGAFMEKGLSMAGGQTPVQKYWPTLLPLVRSGELDPTTVITHVLGLGDAPEAYKHFNAKDEGWVKVLLKPQRDPDVVTEAGAGLAERARNLVSGAVAGTVQTVQSATSVMSTDVNK